MESKRLGKLLCIFATAFIAIAIGVAPVQAEVPSPKYRQFAGCPDPKTENPEVTTCIRTTFLGGNVRLGKKEIPLTAPMSFVTGLNAELGNLVNNPRGGLQPVKQAIPGGLSSPGLNGLIGSAKIDRRLYAVSESVGPVLFGADEIAKLSLKLHLLNSALGNNCYIGSNANPINVNLTMRTTTPPPPFRPITGREPVFQFDEETGIMGGTGGTLVDNSFAVPGAQGCTLTLSPGGLALTANGLINELVGLPARAGVSAMVIQGFGVEITDPGIVYP